MLLGVVCWCPVFQRQKTKQQNIKKQVKTADVKMRFGEGPNVTH